MTHHRGLAAAIGAVVAGLAVLVGLAVAVAYAGQGGSQPPAEPGATAAPTAAATVGGAMRRPGVADPYDANGDGVADPDQVDDAALAAGRYLCHSGELTDAAAWRRAVFSFNHSDAYVDDIAGLANTYAQRSG